MTTFRVSAVNAYHLEAQELQVYRQEKARQFSERAAARFRERISPDADICIVAMTPRLTLIVTDGTEIEARDEYDAVEFYFAAECGVCGDKSYRRVATLSDIGRYIAEGLGVECPCMETAAPDDAAARLVAAIRDLLNE